MPDDDLSLTFDAFNAHIVRTAIVVGSPPGESADDRMGRIRATIAMFRALDPRTPMQAMIAGQYLIQRDAAIAAMKALNAPDLDEKTLTRMRAVATTMTRALDTLFIRLEKLKAATPETIPEEAAPAPPAETTKKTIPSRILPTPPPPGPPRDGGPVPLPNVPLSNVPLSNGAAHPPPGQEYVPLS